MIRRVVEAVEKSSVDAVASPCHFSESSEVISSHTLVAEKSSFNAGNGCYDNNISTHRSGSATDIYLSGHIPHPVDRSKWLPTYSHHLRAFRRCQSLYEVTREPLIANSLRNPRGANGLNPLTGPNYQSLPNSPSRLSRETNRKSKRSLNTTKVDVGNVATCTTDGHTKRQEVDGLSCQINEDLIEMEVLILPMVSDPSQNEVRIPASSLSAESHKILKRVAAENELVLLNIGKGKSRCVVVRKKASLQQRQALQMEAALKAAEEDRLKREEEERRLQAEIERPTEQPTHITMAIQTTAQEETLSESPAKGRSGRGKRAQQPPPPAQPPMNAAARRRARRQAAAKAAAAAALRRSRMVETDVQTCPPDHRVCPWCTLDIPPEAQCGHEEVCRAGFKQRERQAKVEAQLAQHRLAVENARRRKRGLAPKKVASGPSTTMTATRARNSSRSPSRNRSRSRTRSVDAHLSAALKRQALLNAQLERVHPNDLDGMVHATHRVCSLVDCPRLLGGAGGSCTYCKLLFCPQHRPPHSGHDCKLAPPPPPEPPGQEAVDGKVSMACGEDYEERRLALRSRLRDKLKTLADKRQR